MTPDELLVVAKRDEEILGADRRAFLALLQTRRPELAGVLRNEAGETVGYALGREGRVATQIDSCGSRSVGGARFGCGSR